ncbi:MAG: hypothetical protein HOP17_09655 [Acidobacteria bacterium]|nr:hypothetical protein [Acidobacteriota bacterium]
MLKTKIISGVAVMAAFAAFIYTSEPVSAAGKKRSATFQVRIENISNPDGLSGLNGEKYPFAISPGVFYANSKKDQFFQEGKKADAALEAQAEDGNPDLLAKKLLTKVGSVFMGVFNKPVGSELAAPLLPGGAFEFSFTAEEGMRFNLITMFGQSNDLFYSSKQAIELFDDKGNPLTGDITEQFQLWDAGTEKNQAPGIGDEQAPRQKMANTGTAEQSVVGPVKDQFTYPNTKDVLRITITAR